MFRTKVFLFF
jgi:probable aminopeptidase NPEPL1